MLLSPGTTLGPYAVTAKIGEGGMGEVYRARDTKLDRDVALKVLPQAFTDDPDRLARFEREAKVLASLNHPNIGHIYFWKKRKARRRWCSMPTDASNAASKGESLGKVLVGALEEDHQNDGSIGIQERNLRQL